MAETNNTILSPSRRRSAGESAYDALLHAILNMQLQPGDTVSEVSLSEQLALSRTPIREALKRLEHEGLIIVIPRKGSIVAPLDADEIEDGSELRAMIECRCLERAFRHGFSNADIERLRIRLRHMEEAWNARDLSGYVQGDVAFHDTIVALGRSGWSTRMINTINTQLQRARYWTSDQRKVESTFAEHEAIVAAICADDRPKAVQTLRAHILQLPERVAEGEFSLDEAFRSHQQDA